MSHHDQTALVQKMLGEALQKIRSEVRENGFELIFKDSSLEGRFEIIRTGKNDVKENVLPIMLTCRINSQGQVVCH